MKIKQGDLVQVIAGSSKDKGKQGKVVKTLAKKDRVVVEGVKLVTKHVKPSQQNSDGGIVTIEAPIHVSNVMIVDPKTKKPTRVGYTTDKNGNKVRVTKASNTILDK